LLAERQSVRVGPHTEMSVSVLPILFAAVVLGPLAAVIVGASALVGDFRTPYIRWAVWTCQRALVGGLAGTAASLVGSRRSAFGQLSPCLVLFFFAPALAAQRLFLLYQEQRHLAEGLASANDRLERANLSFATALVATLDARDQYTAGHSAAVAVYARDIAERMGLADEDQQLVHLCGLVHDIGKVGLQLGLIEMPGALTLE